MSHFKDICSCGTVINQCRCMSADKKINVIKDSCAKCMNKFAPKHNKDDTYKINRRIKTTKKVLPKT